MLIRGGGVVLGFGLAAFVMTGCFKWQNGVTINGVSYRKVRIDKGGLAIGLLKEDTVIGERACRRGWVHVHSNGVPAGFTAAKPIGLARFTIPAGTWVFQNEDGVVTVCAFPRDTEVQGHLCRGSGGPTGVQAAFYPSGALKQYFLRHDMKIQGIPCKAGVFDQWIELHENGRLKACVLSESFTHDGRTHQRGKRIQLDREGRILTGTALLISTPVRAADARPTNYVRGEFHQLNDNGAWSWFMDERAIVDSGRLLVGSVRANGTFRDNTNPGWGNVELAVLNLQSGQRRALVLHERFEQDDHNGPGLLMLSDGRYLAAYSKHNQEPRVYFRISTTTHDPFDWQPVTELPTPGVKGNWTGDNFTYCNPFRLTGEKGRIYLFHRGVGQDPNYLVSDDDGRTWTYGGKLYIGRDGYSPYTKYASNGRDTIHFVATEDHPRNFDNSLYHAFIRGGKIFGSDGRLVAPLATSSNTTVRASDLTRIYQGGPSNVAWMTDFHLDARERPVVLFTTQRDGAGLPRRQGGMDHRFHYASWDGKRWVEHEIAYAGKRLYAGEDDYTGLGAIDPQNPSVVYLSTDADPKTGQPLISAADARRHHEIFRGETRDGGATWQWTSITANSTVDNLRPIVPVWNDPRTALVWIRGTYTNNRGEWTTKVVVTVLKRSDF